MSNKNPKSMEEHQYGSHGRLRKIPTYMHDMALSVNHDVSIVSVFDLKNIASDRVCSHRLNKV